HLAAAVAAPGDAAGLHAFPADAGRSAARRDHPCGESAGAARPRPVARRPARRPGGLGHLASRRTALLAGWRPRRPPLRGRPPAFVTGDRPMRLTLLAAALLLALPTHAQDARTLAQDAIIVDTHIDAPGILMDSWADLGNEAKDREFD